MSRVRIVSASDMNPERWDELAPGSVVVPPEVAGPIVLRFNGLYLLRSDWPAVVSESDDVEWLVDQPEGREDLRTVLAVAAVLAAIIPGAQGFAPYLAAAAVAYNILVPPVTPEIKQANDVFTSSLSGNAARLDDPIWKILGVDRVTPPFAGMPYVEFKDDDGDNLDNQQYFFAVLAVSYGSVTMLADFIGKTPVSHYTDVLIHKILAPGEQPTVALANVITSQDVAGFELDPKTSVGSYVACPPQKTVSSIGIDIVAPTGLGLVDGDGDNIPVRVKWTVQYRRINDAGSPTGPFRTAAGGLEERYMNTNTPQRWSGKYTIEPPGRVEVRVLRTNEKLTGSGVNDSIQWVGLRGYLTEPAELDPDTTHYEIVLRASQQLSQTNQTALNMIVQAHARTWHPDTGWSCAMKDWANYTATRNPAWALADLWSDPTWGEGLPDERIDLQGLYGLSLEWDARQDHCDYTFSSTTDAWAASQLLARTGRARVFRRYGVRTLARDELADIGETAFTPRMCVEGTQMTLSEQLPDSKSPDGIITEYRSNVTWDKAVIECPCPGVSVTDPENPRYDAGLPQMERPIYRSYPGVQGYTHALREGLYDAADIALRRRTVSFQTEMQAVLTSFLAPVRWQPQIPGYGQSGDVAFWDEDTLVMGLTEPADFSVTPIYLTLRRDDGSLTDPVIVTPGPSANDITLPAIPDFQIVVDDGTRERPVFLLGPAMSDELVKTGAITDGGRSPGGAQYYNVTAVVDDPRVHRADNPYLPGPGDIQDPIGIPTGDVDGGDGLVFLDGGIYILGQSVAGGAVNWILTLNPNGSAVQDATTQPSPITLNKQWFSIPIEASTAALYEVMATATFPEYVSNPNIWLNLGSIQQIFVTGPDRLLNQVTVSIRTVDDQIVQASGVYYIQLNITDLGGGGGP